ncbi:MAG: methylenetetrahydrofolate reductase [Alphaproteobacteria bacterium]|jgi:methylenetetrahydrofolate reductase (NADPH)|nr:methylenetetrahydrofolate reductase [Alphaproteobacteria bacterium]MDP6602656.1 methylenetetrahydrofolate reductase [Rhodospirillales bacterium]|tara:strand:+ start:493 stop:1521 length:1029 start_codon:yes stop_codon:yes gene_type:complete
MAPQGIIRAEKHQGVASPEAWKSGSNLERVLVQGHFAVTGELGPPKSHNAELVREKAALLKAYVDAANITDNQTGIVRLSSIAAGIVLVQEGLEPVIQMTCRDRNRLAMQSDLLGAAAHGIRNVLCLSGDHQSFGNHPGAKNVYDIDSMQLLRMVKELRDESRFQCGEEILGGGPRLFIGAAANPFADPVELRHHRLAKKAAAGADFVQTQLIFDMPLFKDYMKRVVDLGLHEKVAILAGVGPLKSPGMARYFRDRIPGLDVADEYIERMAGAVAGISEDDKQARRDTWRAEGIKICVEQVQQVREIEGVAGVHIMAIEWEVAIKSIVEAAGLAPRPVVAAA